MADQDSFDFKSHEQAAVTAYMKQRGFYADLAAVVKRILEESLKRREIPVHSIEGRAKDPTSFGKKAAQPSQDDPTRPRYAAPLSQITDLAGVRVITFFPKTLTLLDEVIMNEFLIVERSDKGAELIEEDRFGYRSIHYLVKLKGDRTRLPEYGPYANAIAEIQVRTILQHAWAEIEHDIQYKTASVIPTEIRRRFMALAGMLEIADREFQAIQDADKHLAAHARSQVEAGQLDDVEITPDALKAYLDRKIGSDGRMSQWSYSWTARLLKRLGFRNLEQVEQCIRGYDDHQVSVAAVGGRMGQLSRFEYMLLAGMGENYIQRHPWGNEASFGTRDREILERLRTHGVPIRSYDPLTELPVQAAEGLQVTDAVSAEMTATAETQS
jgi:ppGpp synthetase/RelA/SpoT-type nucleotidyltranferase